MFLFTRTIVRPQLYNKRQDKPMQSITLLSRKTTFELYNYNQWDVTTIRVFKYLGI